MTETRNAMMCDPVTGMCEIPQEPGATVAPLPEVGKKPVKLIYFTDPICSSCWGIEPQLRRLKLEYGVYFEIDYRMGGLLQSWGSYGGRDVNGPSSVAQHWEQASAHYQMPIDGDVWLEDPLDSSYPPSIAFKAAQLQDENKALVFMRRLREMVFLEKKNIAHWQHIEQAAIDSGLEVTALKADFEGRAKKVFKEDLALARGMGVRGFPTIFFTDEEGNRLLVYGSKPYHSYESALLKLYPGASKKEVPTDYAALFKVYPTMAPREFAELTDNDLDTAVAQLEALVERKAISKSTFKNGALALYTMQN